MMNPPRLTDEQVWLAAWCAVAGTWNVKYKDTPKKWADRCVEDFRKNFPTDPPEQTEIS